MIAESGVKSVTPVTVTAGESDTPPRAAVVSFRFHCSSKPGCDIDSVETFGSLRVQYVRCASPPVVGHSVGLPRP